MAAFPPDIVYLFVGHLQADNDSLKSTSLVCRAWLNISRQFLFAKVYLDDVNHRDFFALLASGAVDGAWVKDLTLVQKNQFWDGRSFPRQWVEVELETLAEKLKSVDSLVLRDVYIKDFRPQSIDLTVTCWPFLTSLEINNVYMGSFELLVNLICHHAHLRRLIIASQEQVDVGNDPQTTIRSRLPPQLTRFWIRDPHTTLLLLDWLISHSQATEIASLYLETCTDRNLLFQLFAAAGQSLQTLGLNLTWIDSQTPNELDSILEPATHLRNLTLTLAPKAGSSIHRTVKMTEAILRSVKSPLKSLTFNVLDSTLAPPPESFRQTHLATIDTLIASFSTLDSVVWNIRVSSVQANSDFEAWRQHIRGQVPLSLSRTTIHTSNLYNLSTRTRRRAFVADSDSD